MLLRIFKMFISIITISVSQVVSDCLRQVAEFLLEHVIDNEAKLPLTKCSQLHCCARPGASSNDPDLYYGYFDIYVVATNSQTRQQGITHHCRQLSADESYDVATFSCLSIPDAFGRLHVCGSLQWLLAYVAKTNIYLTSPKCCQHRFLFHSSHPSRKHVHI